MNERVKILKSDAPQRYTLGTVYAPNEVDSQKDWATSAEIEKACFDFNRRLIGSDLRKVASTMSEALRKAASGAEVTLTVDAEALAKGALGVQHEDWSDDNGEIVESYIAPADMVVNGEAVTKGTWLMGVVWSPDNWAKVEKGEITGYSLGGSAIRLRS